MEAAGQVNQQQRHRLNSPQASARGLPPGYFNCVSVLPQIPPLPT